jgi:hypothetical protein
MAKRKAILASQKAALRAHRSLHPNLSNQALKKWFENCYSRLINSSSVSEILSDKYSYLNEATSYANSQRRRAEHWPELEAALYE